MDTIRTQDMPRPREAVVENRWVCSVRGGLGREVREAAGRTQQDAFGVGRREVWRGLESG